MVHRIIHANLERNTRKWFYKLIVPLMKTSACFALLRHSSEFLKPRSKKHKNTFGRKYQLFFFSIRHFLLGFYPKKFKYITLVNGLQLYNFLCCMFYTYFSLLSRNLLLQWKFVFIWFGIFSCEHFLVLNGFLCLSSGAHTRQIIISLTEDDIRDDIFSVILTRFVNSNSLELE